MSRSFLVDSLILKKSETAHLSPTDFSRPRGGNPYTHLPHPHGAGLHSMAVGHWPCIGGSHPDIMGMYCPLCVHTPVTASVPATSAVLPSLYKSSLVSRSVASPPVPVSAAPRVQEAHRGLPLALSRGVNVEQPCTVTVDNNRIRYSGSPGKSSESHLIYNLIYAS